MQNEQLIEKYLLGDLPDQERERVEERYFTDSDFLEQVQAAEAEIIEDYARGLLSPATARKVEQNLLTSDYQKEKGRFANTLLRAIDQNGERAPVFPQVKQGGKRWWEDVINFFRGPSASGWAIPATAALLLVCGWLIFDRVRLRQELEKSRQELAALQQREQGLKDTIAQQQKLIIQTQDKPQTVEETKNEERRKEVVPRPPANNFATFVLLPVLTRDAQAPPKEFSIPPNIESVRFQLVYDGKSYPSYSVALETGSGDRVLPELGGLKAMRFGKKRKVSFVAPASSFEERTYNVMLRGVTSSGSKVDASPYSFKIKRK